MHPATFPSAATAAMITKAASTQTYFTIRTLVPPRLRDDAFRAYAYYRWLDDRVDGNRLSPQERMDFLESQKNLLACCLEHRPPRALLAEEWLLVDLTQGPVGTDAGLRMYLQDMMKVMDFDVRRRHRRISAQELAWYSQTLAVAVTEAVHTFVGSTNLAPLTPERYVAVEGAHITHMLRDLVDDLDAGYVNIPIEVIPGESVPAEAVKDVRVRQWVQDRVRTARSYFTAGAAYSASIRNLRARIAGAFYSARFKGVLDAIECEGYLLRRAYSKCKGKRAAMNMLWSGLLAALARPSTLAPESPSSARLSAPRRRGSPIPVFQAEEGIHERVNR